LPELPEVETMVRGIRSHVIDRIIENIVACPNGFKPISITPRLTQVRKKLVGQRFAEVRRLGKRVVFDLSDGSNLVIEPRMTGLMVLSDPPDLSHLRIQISFRGPGAFGSLWFWDRRGLGTVTWFEPGELQNKLGSRALGSDALDFGRSEWTECCRKTSREIKVLLLDQKVVAGIGNIYASEILHRAGIHPSRPANSLKVGCIDKLADAVRSVLLMAIECEGSTLGDGTYRNALNQNGSYQNEHRVYMREGQTCLSCGKSEITRIVQAQRSTFFCVNCQKERK
jgi:formamidopyrimidine-DNA glycosylase